MSVLTALATPFQREGSALRDGAMSTDIYFSGIICNVVGETGIGTRDLAQAIRMSGLSGLFTTTPESHSRKTAELHILGTTGIPKSERSVFKIPLAAAIRPKSAFFRSLFSSFKTGVVS